jgi:hypothetical protein
VHVHVHVHVQVQGQGQCQSQGRQMADSRELSQRVECGGDLGLNGVKSMARMMESEGELMHVVGGIVSVRAPGHQAERPPGRIWGLGRVGGR